MSFPMDQSSSSTLESSPPVLDVEPSKYLSSLAAKRILVLGGTSGIGFAIAEAAVEHNAMVIIASSNLFKVEKALHRLRTAYPSRAFALSGMACNLADPATLESEIVDILEFATGYKQALLDHIAFTAGGLIMVCPIAEASVEYMQSVCVVRFLAPMVLAKHAPAYLRPGPDSSITFTGGGNAHKPVLGWGIPAAYGAGLEGLTRGMAQDLKPTRVNLISPGAVCTEEFSRVAASTERRQELLESFRMETLTGRVGRPEDLAEAYLHCMKNGFLTGTIISVDGGRLIN